MIMYVYKEIILHMADKLVMRSYSTEKASELPSKFKIDYKLFVGMLLVDRLSFFLSIKSLVGCLNLGDFLVDSLV